MLKALNSIANRIILFSLLFPSLLEASLNDYIYPNRNIPSFSNYSTLGLIQNPNARFYDAGTISFSWSNMDPYLRGSIVAYPFDWFEAAYHYTDINNALYSLSPDFSGNQTYKDKGFDFKFRLLKESQIFPQVAFGIRDFAGTGVFAAEYIAASKKINNLDFTLGLGWGSLSNNQVSNPFNLISDHFEFRKSELTNTQGGEPNFKRFFTGQPGIFGGVEIIFPSKDGIRAKIEYDGTDYLLEGFPNGQESFKFAFEPVRQSQSKWNFGLVYPVNKSMQLKASFVKGNTLSFGFSLSGFFGPKDPIIIKNDRMPDVKNINEVKYLTANNDLFLYRAALIELRDRGFYLRNANKDDAKLTVTYAQSNHTSYPRVIGRVATVLDQISPEYIDEFEIINMNAGMPMHSATVNRKDFIRYKKDNLYSVAKRSIELNEVNKLNKDKFSYNPAGSFPNTFWRIAPNIRSQIGGPDGFFFGDLSLSYQSETKFTPNIALNAQANIGITDNFDNLKLDSDSVLPHVRTDIVQYLKQSKKYNIQSLHLNIFNKPFKDIYTKFSIGLLESMFGGFGGEILYRPFGGNFGLGAELWAVKQREYDMLLKFRDYDTVTGHINWHYKEPKSQIIFTVRGGRFLAKDSGLNFDFARRFPSGVTIGAFFSRTDISKAEFGEGSFDKGFYFNIPVEAFFSNYRRGYTGFGLRPLTRDGAAFLIHSHHLWGVTEQAQDVNISRDWDDLYD